MKKQKNKKSIQNTTETLFIDNFSLIFQLAARLISSWKDLKDLFPIHEDDLNDLSTEEINIIDNLIYRFSKLQDMLGSKIFIGILSLDMEEAGTMRDVINKMEKRYILDIAEDWENIREARNKVTHQYTPTGKQASETLNEIFAIVPELIKIIHNIYTYAQEEIGLDMSRFDMKQLKIAKKNIKKKGKKNAK